MLILAKKRRGWRKGSSSRDAEAWTESRKRARNYEQSRAEQRAEAALDTLLLLYAAGHSPQAPPGVPNSTTNLQNQQHSCQMYNAVPKTPTRHYYTVAQLFESGTEAQPFGDVW